MRETFVCANKLHPGNALSNDQLALVETLAIGCHATNRGAPEEETQTLIIGAGPIGLATLEFSVWTGAKVTVMTGSPAVLNFAERPTDAHTLHSQGETGIGTNPGAPTAIGMAW